MPKSQRSTFGAVLGNPPAVTGFGGCASLAEKSTVALHYKLKSLVACFQQFIAY
jgi:hypothetical protein